MGEMSHKVHGKDLITLVRLVSIKSVLKSFNFCKFLNQIKIISHGFPTGSQFHFQILNLQPQTNYLENWKLKIFSITTQGIIFDFACLLPAKVKYQILQKLDTLICEKVASLKYPIWFQHEVILNRMEEGPFFEVFTTFLPGFSLKICFTIGLIAPAWVLHLLKREEFSDLSKLAGN